MWRILESLTQSEALAKLLPAVADGVRFELTKGFPLPVFKTGAFNRSATHPLHFKIPGCGGGFKSKMRDLQIRSRKCCVETTQFILNCGLGFPRPR